jgi:formyltetrahydrofolate deformylase
MIIVVQCRDQVGLVAAISNVIAKENLSILGLREYVDPSEGLFFARLEVESYQDISEIQLKLRQVLPQGAIVEINPNPQKQVVVLVTKEHHCLADLLVRNHYQTIGANIKAVVGNHPDLKEICDRFGVRFHLISSEGRTSSEFESELMGVLREYQPEYLVLAKFMRVLSPQFVELFANRIINIHHSFLPAFVGSQPYLRAFKRGVKLIGATAHFVTEDLDAGPIIAQQTIPVTHAHAVKDMIKAGREIEAAVLARALQLVFEDRVFVFKNRTVVFD